jgi:hypothetical protein
MELGVRNYDRKEIDGQVFNYGNPNEFTILELAEALDEAFNRYSMIRYEDLPIHDPLQRRPDISKAKITFGDSITPKVELREGLLLMREYMTKKLIEVAIAVFFEKLYIQTTGIPRMCIQRVAETDIKHDVFIDWTIQKIVIYQATISLYVEYVRATNNNFYNFAVVSCNAMIPLSILSSDIHINRTLREMENSVSGVRSQSVGYAFVRCGVCLR